jgi:hypothetical protein
MKPETALFIALKREFFEAFKDGSKREEFRAYGPRWNERTCRVGRRVTLSLGYGKQHRLSGVIVGFRQDKAPTYTRAWFDCFGSTGEGMAACIGIKLDES